MAYLGNSCNLHIPRWPPNAILKKITFERHIIKCYIVPYLCMYLLCRIHFWCYFFNSRTTSAVIYTFQDGPRTPSWKNLTFERHIIECCIIPHLYMYLVCRIHFWCYFFNSRTTLAVIYIFQDGHQIQNGVQSSWFAGHLLKCVQWVVLLGGALGWMFSGSFIGQIDVKMFVFSAGWCPRQFYLFINAHVFSVKKLNPAYMGHIRQI